MICRHREVAGGDELAARRGRDAVDLGDDRLGQGGDHLHDLGAAGEEIGEIGAAPVGGGAAGLHLLQVVTGAEGAPRPPQDHDAGIAVFREPGERRLQRGGHRV